MDVHLALPIGMAVAFLNLLLTLCFFLKLFPDHHRGLQPLSGTSFKPLGNPRVGRLSAGWRRTWGSLRPAGGWPLLFRVSYWDR